MITKKNMWHCVAAPTSATVYTACAERMSHVSCVCKTIELIVNSDTVLVVVAVKAHCNGCGGGGPSQEVVLWWL